MKPEVKIKNVGIVQYPNGAYSLSGTIDNHPNFANNTLVNTSRILKVETKNTIYVIDYDKKADTQENEDTKV